MTTHNYTEKDASFQCNNPDCKASRSLDAMQEQAVARGMAFAHCGETIFQILDCCEPSCNGKIVISSDPNNPALDMRDLVLAPLPSPLTNAVEQSWFLRNREKWHKFLRFKVITAWDKSLFSEIDFINAFNFPSTEQFSFPFPENSFSISEELFYEYLNLEIDSGCTILRRLLPNNHKYRMLLTCLAPYKIREILSAEAAVADGLSIEDLKYRRNAIMTFMENAKGKPIGEYIKDILATKKVFLPDYSIINDLIDTELPLKMSFASEQLWNIVFKNGFDHQLDLFFNKFADSIINPIATQLSLSEKRKDLLKWHMEASHGKALFVDAPMGLGKTYSIVETLSKNSALSAVIFMPTNKLCQEIVENLKRGIAQQKKIDPFEVQRHQEKVYDDNGSPKAGEDGLFEYNFKRNFLEDEVYYADGINPNECLHFEEIAKRYSENWISKKDICKNCKTQINCRYLLHQEKLLKSRIVVTTHQQYDLFYSTPNLAFYHEHNSNEKLQRDFFIIDEDIVVSKCYQPTAMDKPRLKAFIATISDFMTNPNNLKGNPIPEVAVANIESVLSRFERCDTSAIVPPIDPDFQIPDYVAESWNALGADHYHIIPETLDWSESIGNHLSLIENAIKKGFVVQSYEKTFNTNGQKAVIKIKKAYLPNPKFYDLSNLPPHVFFDGTMLDQQFISNKIRNVEIKKFTIDVEPIWDIKLYQNIWTDLPKTRIDIDKKKVQSVINDIIVENGIDKKYFIVTNKELRDSYLEDWIKHEFPGINLVISHYGNLRGVNDAKDCDVGIMLGSYLPPDAVEISMAIDFIQGHLDKNRIMPTCGVDYLWTFAGNNFQRRYNDKFSIVGDLAKAYRQSEHRQALARTRYLFHDVDFYVLSKDLVGDYEPFFNQIETNDFRNDLFFKKKRSDNKYSDVKAAVDDWLSKHPTVNQTDIYINYGIRRQTVGPYLEEMYNSGLLSKKSKKVYKLANKTD